jgi:probable rRNA maturation factor
MISFFNPYSEFSPEVEATVISAANEIISEYHLELGYINVVFLSDDELLKMNVEYLGHDYYTDIITFNYAENPKRIEAELYISIDRVKENAETNHVSFNEEMIRVIIHGTLHLAGFDDQTDAEKTEMRRLEDQYIKSASFHVKRMVEKTRA